MIEKVTIPLWQNLIDRLSRQDYFRIVLLGASNTERFFPCLHWTDVLEVGLAHRFKRKFHIINSGMCGNNTVEAMKRFDRDVAAFQPDIVIVTLGGNDCRPNPEKFIPPERFAENMRTIIHRIQELNAVPILQTYYQMNIEELEKTEPGRGGFFLQNMQAVRDVAEQTGTLLADQHRIFSLLPESVLLYRLLHDMYHLNEYGNMVFAIMLLAHFGIDAAALPHNDKLLPAARLCRTYAQSGCWQVRI